MAHLISVNVGAAHHLGGSPRATGIDKRPVAGPVEVRPVGPKGHSGLVGDFIGEARHHGGDEQAVYAYAREDHDTWTETLGRSSPPGSFGENLTTAGLDVSGAVAGERWRIGDVVLEVTGPRIPCATFARWLERDGWIQEFRARARPGAYLRVLTGGSLAAGDVVEVVDRPDHGVTIRRMFQALTTQPELLPGLLVARDHLTPEIVDRAEGVRPFVD